MKAILLHHAGGDRYAFKRVEEKLSPHFATKCIELPGRGDRFGEKRLTNFEFALHDILTQIEKEINEPYFFVGVSMGVAFAFELTHVLQAEGHPLPNALFLASRRSEEDYSELQRFSLSDKEVFWEHILTYDEKSKHLLHHPEILEVVEPVLRADFSILEDYHDTYALKPKLPVPAYILYGAEDLHKNNEETSAKWQKHFTTTIEVKIFEGGHFFLYENQEVASFIISKMKGND